jgi:hypothetical protein
MPLILRTWFLAKQTGSSQAPLFLASGRSDARAGQVGLGLSSDLNEAHRTRIKSRKSTGLADRDHYDCSPESKLAKPDERGTRIETRPKAEWERSRDKQALFCLAGEYV